MPTLKRNTRQVLAAQPINGKRTRYRIEGVPGLRLDVGPNGKRIWYVRYQPGGRETRRFRYYKIGDAASIGLQAATNAAHDVLNAVQVERRDPIAERTAAAINRITFADLYDEWYERHAEPKLARAPTDQTIFRCHIKSEFGGRVI